MDWIPKWIKRRKSFCWLPTFTSVFFFPVDALWPEVHVPAVMPSSPWWTVCALELCCCDTFHSGGAQTPRSWCLAAAQSNDGQSGVQETYLPSLHLQPDLGHGSRSAVHSSSGSGDPGWKKAAAHTCIFTMFSETVPGTLDCDMAEKESRKPRKHGHLQQSPWGCSPTCIQRQGKHHWAGTLEHKHHLLEHNTGWWGLLHVSLQYFSCWEDLRNSLPHPLCTAHSIPSLQLFWRPPKHHLLCDCPPSPCHCLEGHWYGNWE